MNYSEIRRENLRMLIDKHGTANLAAKLGYRQASFLSQMAGPNPTRPVTETNARRFEEALNLPEGYFDALQNAAKTIADKDQLAKANATSTALVVDVIRLVGEVCACEAVSLPPMKFADVVVLAYTDTMEHDGKPRESYIKQVVRLLK
ncbi:MAG: hypothetical protein ACREXQ_06030 [Polaromonas sp.]